MAKETMIIYCGGCQVDVEAILTNGKEIYPHRQDLHDLPFWKCEDCGNFVGCHYKTKNRTNPLGFIPTPEVRNARRHIHNILDPIWQSGKINRRVLYKMLSEKLGWKYHTAKIRNLEEARVVYRTIKGEGGTLLLPLEDASLMEVKDECV